MSSIDAVLLDIEGTLSSQSYVAATLFPFSRRRIPGYVAKHAAEPVVQQILADTADLAERGEDPVAALIRWIDEDRKAGPLKTIQGLVWDEGFTNGTLYGHIFADSLAALRRWKAAGMPRYIFSSGSVHAQVQFLGHCKEGDLSGLFDGNFDLTAGPKTDPSSYIAIATNLRVPAPRLRYFSDDPRELAAAEAAGLQVIQVIREDTAPDPRFIQVQGFDEPPVWAE